MIYFYSSISPFAIDRLNEYINHFFEELFKLPSPTYTHAAYIHPDFLPIVTAYRPQIDNKLEAIFGAYVALSTTHRQVVQNAYSNNNDIEGICNNRVAPFKYVDLPASIQVPLKSLYDSLWDPILTKYTQVAKICGTVKSHFDHFRKINKYTVCPFCGLNPLLSEHDSGKDAYDHFIPLAKYPFCSVNFKNLVPACHNCNSKYKNQTDTPFSKLGAALTRRRLYYPYDTLDDHNITIRIYSGNTDLGNPKRWKLGVYCTPNIHNREKNAWLTIYKIQERYKARIAKDSYKWKERIIKEYDKQCRMRGRDFSEVKEDLLTTFADCLNIPEGIIRKCFDEFILNDVNCENNLRGII